jgi:hypothetical protein
MASRSRRPAALVLCLAVAGVTAACASSPPVPPVAARQSASSAAASRFPCAAEYRALLDLARLAQQYGTSTTIFLGPLGDMFDQLDDCLSATDNDGASHPVIQEIRGRRRFGDEGRFYLNEMRSTGP